MLHIYLKLAIRNLIKNKLYSAINIVGLAVGLCAFTFILLFVNDELSYDKHFTDSDRIYRISGVYDQGGNANVLSAETTYGLAPILNANFPEMEVTARVDFMSGLVSVGDQRLWQDHVALVDSSFFDLFSVQLLKGYVNKALHEPTNVILSASAAQKHFGSENPIGQVLAFQDVEFKVAAVIDDLPEQTHFQAELFIPNQTAIAWYGDWVHMLFAGTSHLTYFRLEEGVEAASFEARINEFLTETYPPENRTRSFFLQPLESIHLESDLASEAGVNGNILTVLVFIATAVVILVLAVINYINLSVAGSFTRSKEVGIKKIFGARGRTQIVQFQVESIIIAVVACILGIIAFELLLPFFNNLTGKSFSFNLQENLYLMLSMIGLAAVIGVVAGAFPASFLLRMNTIAALKGNVMNRKTKGVSVRNVLVTFQLLVAVVLIVSTFTIISQVNYMRNTDLGIDTEQVVVFPLQTMEMVQQFDLFKEELERNAGILNVTASTNSPTARVGGWRGYGLPGAESFVNVPTVIVAHDYFKTMGIELKEGRAFSQDFETDYMEAYVINESAAEFLGLEEPVGASITGMAFTGSEWSRKNARIIGVVKDFHFSSLHEEIQPAVFSLASEATMGVRIASIKVSPENISQTMAQIEAKWNEMSPEQPFQFSFLDEDIEENYRSEQQFLSVFKSFSLLAILIGCLGLFGLTGYIMKLKTKNIGIRKVLGASKASLLQRLSKDFLLQALIANLLGWPVAYLLMSGWLENFAYQMPQTTMPYLMTFLVICAITVLTIAYHTLRTASVNPTILLRNE